MYHYTAAENRASILAHGLRGSDATSPGGYPVVFFTDTYTPPTNGFDVYAIDIATLRDCQFVHEVGDDYTTEPFEGERWYYAAGNIPASLLTLNPQKTTQ